MLTELNSSPTILSTGDGVQPQGVVVVSGPGHSRDHDGGFMSDFDDLFRYYF